MGCETEKELEGTERLKEELCLWASCRGQTLIRTGKVSIELQLCILRLTSLFYISNILTFFSQYKSLLDSMQKIFVANLLLNLDDLTLVRGMMYYRKALELQAFLDMAKDEGKA